MQKFYEVAGEVMGFFDAFKDQDLQLTMKKS